MGLYGLTDVLGVAWVYLGLNDITAVLGVI